MNVILLHGRGWACPARGLPVNARFPYIAGPDMSGPYRNIKDKHLSAVYLPIAAHFSFSQTFSASFRRGLSIS